MTFSPQTELDERVDFASRVFWGRRILHILCVYVEKRRVIYAERCNYDGIPLLRPACVCCGGGSEQSAWQRCVWLALISRVIRFNELGLVDRRLRSEGESKNWLVAMGFLFLFVAWLLEPLSFSTQVCNDLIVRRRPPTL